MSADNSPSQDPAAPNDAPIQAESVSNTAPAAPPQQQWQQPVAPPKPNIVIRVFSRLIMFGFLGMMLLLMVLVVATVFGIASSGGASSSSASLQEKHFSHKRRAENRIAIITVSGTITSGQGFVKDQIDRVKKDESIRGVVLRINSPGGTITGSDYILHHLKELKKAKEEEVIDGKKQGDFPIVVSMGALAASGGYYIAMAVEDTPGSIYAEPTTWTGSIGVIIPHYNFKGLMETWGVEEDPVTSGKFKGMGSLSKPIEGEELVIFQELVDTAFNRFKDIIKEGRPEFAKDPQKLDDLATGQIYTANQAKEGGLVDEIGFIEAAVERTIELAKVDEKNVSVIRYKPEPTLSGILFGETQTKQAAQLNQVSQLLELSVPRGYYLCTMLPAAVTSAE